MLILMQRRLVAGLSQAALLLTLWDDIKPRSSKDLSIV